MVRPMEVDEDGVSGRATPAESATESSVHKEETPESTEARTPFRISPLANVANSKQDGSVHVCLLDEELAG